MDASAVYEAVRLQRQALRRPPRTAEQLLDTFEQQGLPQMAARLRLAIELI